jgi:hypothetical protein
MTAKQLFRNIVGFVVVIPTVLRVRLLATSVGKEKAIARLGPKMTAMAKWSLRFWVPALEDASEFDLFASKMKARFRLWEPFYDIKVVKEDQNTFKLCVENCPFCEALTRLGLPELGPYVCQGDWEIARENADKWGFERDHQIGTGDAFCDHTYLRKQQ